MDVLIHKVKGRRKGESHIGFAAFFLGLIKFKEVGDRVHTIY